MKYISTFFCIFLQNVNKLQHQESDQQILFPECFLSFPGSKNISSFDKLWMCLYCKLRDLCLDTRPSVRKSSGQTLFSTIAAHGSMLEANTWQAVLWQVLFPLLDNVIIQSDNASTERVSQSQVNVFFQGHAAFSKVLMGTQAKQACFMSKGQKNG